MTPRFARFFPTALPIALVLALTAGAIPAQQPVPLLPPPGTQPGGVAQPPQAEQADPNAPEVLARGPVHEAFATTAEAPVPTPIIAKQPPDPIDELPPDQKPAGDNVVWLPGYWHWDEDATQYIWISGFWRNLPPGRIWLPGSWRQAQNGWQWVPGLWQEAPPPQQAQQPQQQPELQYLPPPPNSVEVGPTVPAPTATSFYVPGSWVYRGRYAWRPGFWIEYRPGWVWVPAHFRWTPAGYLFVEGYWDYPLAQRGVLFAPVAFQPAVIARPGFFYTPTYVVSEPCMVGALFVRRGWGCYYFGDYFAPGYATVGYSAWCGTIGPRGGFAVGFGVGRAWGYDPLWSYYSVAYRGTPGWSVGVTAVYGGRFNGTVARPPVTLVQQNTVINHITNVNVRNVTNNVTVVNKNVMVNNKNVTDVTMVAPMKVAGALHPEAKMQPISAQVRRQEFTHAQQMREVGVQRNKLETTAAVRPVLKANDPPHNLKLDVPRNIVTQAHATDPKTAIPAHPIKDPKGALKVDPKTDHKADPHSIFHPKFDPNAKIDPKNLPKNPPKNPPPKNPAPRNLPPKHDPRPMRP